MKKLLLPLLIAPVIFVSCSRDEDSQTYYLELNSTQDRVFFISIVQIDKQKATCVPNCVSSY